MIIRNGSVRIDINKIAALGDKSGHKNIFIISNFMLFTSFSRQLIMNFLRNIHCLMSPTDKDVKFQW